MSQPVPKGFRLAGVHCGIKSNAAKEDLTLIVTDADSVAAGVYTQNLVVAASVVQNRAKTPCHDFRVVVVNSGNANACTGERGDSDCREMTRLAAEAVGATENQALVMSTGIIGHFLPMEKIKSGIAAATAKIGTDADAFDSAVRGITTTDKFLKTASRSVEIAGQTVQVTAMAKGAGMIGPNMATMLCVVMTDAKLTAPAAQELLTHAAELSFNCISVEGHTSTSDTALLLASGGAGVTPTSEADRAAFQQTLDEVCVELAKLIPSDGEGATHLITLDVTGCATRADARQIAKTVTESPLVKTAITGNDPNWGRIVSAAGYAGVAFDPAKVTLTINNTLIYKAGMPVAYDEKVVSDSMRDSFEVHLLLAFGEGDASIRFWASDLTVEYVNFNSDYST
ncbi:MAG: bifunctional glutamate N-acetyltransferase/amino-acid acetyltransferase ArgJ [Planctomycetaceae bacterium]|nr:bifunctional glutamate N-acetyltransferase/amino-acid acetyltransferase ArgJ [Planctomycetales bacterium]MCB9874143.1 bifunctional glutamate N-acetyltransferase/amino-acid acetyltransferase ArgJ [Planctomycetaceae bacterium]MCB9940596.1 bifunctional glutamate N-acetyltransferase/amino-acid acetyltransferase ArgJ [Planctomycetaceae bacterium]HRX77636.1 bifunctional glutamate N-acetyltransferase/amino-acid acetyltransferase ArgJ [Pirellulaceae bacterium]